MRPLDPDGTRSGFGNGSFARFVFIYRSRMKEIERKFLVEGEGWRKLASGPGRLVCQGYLSTDPERVVRIRIDGDEGFITIKGRTEGITRAEYEYPIPLSDARSLMALGCQAPIEKLRHHVPCEGKVWEVDEFLGANSGLVIAEIELSDEKEPFALPFPNMHEVSGDERYYNNNLSLHPYSMWKT